MQQRGWRTWGGFKRSLNRGAAASGDGCEPERSSGAPPPPPPPHKRSTHTHAGHPATKRPAREHRRVLLTGGGRRAGRRANAHHAHAVERRELPPSRDLAASPRRQRTPQHTRRGSNAGGWGGRNCRAPRRPPTPAPASANREGRGGVPQRSALGSAGDRSRGGGGRSGRGGGGGGGGASQAGSRAPLMRLLACSHRHAVQKIKHTSAWLFANVALQGPSTSRVDDRWTTRLGLFDAPKATDDEFWVDVR